MSVFIDSWLSSLNVSFQFWRRLGVWTILSEETIGVDLLLLLRTKDKMEGLEFVYEKKPS